MKDGTITMGKGKHDVGNLIGSDPSKLPEEKNKKGHAHTHPVAVFAILSYMKGGISGGGKFSPGPSSEDMTEARKNTGGIRNVVVDKNNVYLITGWTNETVIIKRK